MLIERFNTDELAGSYISLADAMTDLALRFGKMRNVKVFAVMFLVAGRAGQIP